MEYACIALIQLYLRNEVYNDLDPFLDQPKVGLSHYSPIFQSTKVIFTSIMFYILRKGRDWLFQNNSNHLLANDENAKNRHL